MQFLEDGFREAGSDVADGFVGLCACVVASKKERAIYTGPLPFAVVCTEDPQIERLEGS